MPAGPVEYPVQQGRPRMLTSSEAEREHLCLFFAEVVKLDSLPDVEGSKSSVADQIRRCSHTQQAKGQFLEFRVFAATVIELSDACKELVGRKRQAAHRVNLINKCHNATPAPRQYYLPHRSHPSLQRPDARSSIPELFEFIFEGELLSHLGKQAAVPLLGGQIHADGCEVKDRNSDALISQSRRGADHERGLARLPSGEHVTELSAVKAVVKLVVSLSSDIAECVARKGSARDVERTVDLNLNAFHRTISVDRLHNDRNRVHSRCLSK